MADLTITAANVILSGSTNTVVTAIAGETITAGMPIHAGTNSAMFKSLSGGVGATAVTAASKGIALHGATAGQPISYIQLGQLAFGAILTVGETYVVSDNAAGAICPLSDLATGAYVTYLGIASTTSVLNVSARPTGIAKAA